MLLKYLSLSLSHSLYFFALCITILGQLIIHHSSFLCKVSGIKNVNTKANIAKGSSDNTGFRL